MRWHTCAAIAVPRLLLLPMSSAFLPTANRRSPSAIGPVRMMAAVETTSIALDASTIAPFLSPSVARSIELGGLPALGMLVATCFGLRVPTPANVVGALQHFAAGILLTTVAKELLPEMVNAKGLMENLASGIGFFSGVGVLILLGILLPEDEHDKENESDKSVQTVKPSLRNRKVSRKSEAFARLSSFSDLSRGRTGDEMRQGWRGNENSASWEVMGSELDNFAPVAPVPPPQQELLSTEPPPVILPPIASSLPAALLAAVSIDSALDGLLIGTSTALDPSTGSILSASLAVESSFLGLTIATALRSCSPTKSLLGATFAPASILTAAVAGGSLAPILAESPVLLAGLLGFGTSATLFMVAEELLLEAHEDGGDHVWWVDFQLYTGFFASVMVDKYISSV